MLRKILNLIDVIYIASIVIIIALVTITVFNVSML